MFFECVFNWYLHSEHYGHANINVLYVGIYTVGTAKYVPIIDQASEASLSNWY